MSRHTDFIVTLLCYYLLFIDEVQCTRSLSTKGDLDEDIHLKSLKKPSINNIQDKYGDIHDCVDVHNQVAFDHPFLKNHTVDFQIVANVYGWNNSYKASKRNFSTSNNSLDPISKTQMCPVGTIPIRRISINDLTGENRIKEANETETANRPNTYLAIARTKVGASKYSGVGGNLKLDNPKVVGKQFSATRIRLEAGPDSIEAGWRVDPSLYGDSRTRLFIRTDAGQTHCFNTRCPGFIQTNHGANLDVAFDSISVPGGPMYDMQFYIIKDKKNGNWNLFVGETSIFVGYWPSHIFTRLKGLADRVEWGAAAYSPPGTPLPPMGSGNHPVRDPLWDGYTRRMKVLNERGLTVDASDFETYADDSKLYSVLDDVYSQKVWGHVILYGGSGH